MNKIRQRVDDWREVTKTGWGKLAKNLQAEIDEDMIEVYRGTQSLPFETGGNGRIAVKIVDDRGVEILRVVELNETVMKSAVSK